MIDIKKIKKKKQEKPVWKAERGERDFLDKIPHRKMNNRSENSIYSGQNSRGI